MDRFKHVRMCHSLHMEIVCQTGRYKDSEIKHYICFTSKHGHLINELSDITKLAMSVKRNAVALHAEGIYSI